MIFSVADYEILSFALLSQAIINLPTAFSLAAYVALFLLSHFPTCDFVDSVLAI